MNNQRDTGTHAHTRAQTPTRMHFRTARMLLTSVPPHRGLLILDIDGTCVDTWVAPKVRELKRDAQAHGSKVIFLTARGKEYRAETIEELRGHGLWHPRDALYMTRTQREYDNPGPFKWKVRTSYRPRYDVVVNVGDSDYDHDGRTAGYTHGIVIDNENRNTHWIVAN